MDRNIYKGLSLLLLVALIVGGGYYSASAHRALRGGDGEEMRIRYKLGHGQELEVLANILGTSVEDLQTRIEAGETIRDIIDASGLSQDELHEKIQEAHIQKLNELVAEDTITQEEADARISHIAEREARMEAMRETHDAIEAAIEANDYNAFIVASEGLPISEQITSENFSRFIEAHNLRESGDIYGAREIMNELGIRPPMKHRGMFLGGMQRGFGSN